MSDKNNVDESEEVVTVIKDLVRYIGEIKAVTSSHDEVLELFHTRITKLEKIQKREIEVYKKHIKELECANGQLSTYEKQINFTLKYIIEKLGINISDINKAYDEAENEDL